MKYKIWWLIAAGVLLMGIGMTASQAALQAGSPTVPGGYDLISATAGGSSAQGAAMTLDNISEIQALVKDSKFSWWAAGQGTIGTDDRSTSAQIYAVSGAFQDLHHMDMLYGSFLPRSGAGATAAVLDSALAYRIFGTQNAVGMEVKYSGRTFQVCGVTRADDSLIGLMSGGGQFRAYLSGYDLIATNKLSIGGFEAIVSRGAPGESLQAVKTAMTTEGISTGSFLFRDLTEQQQLNKEVSVLPLVLLALSAIIILLVFFLRAVRGIARQSIAILRDGYMRDVWGALLWQLTKIVLLAGASVGLAALLWSNVHLDFLLPAKYIPSSWIDLTFYKTLIQTESQAAVAALAYAPQWWDTKAAAAVGLSRGLGLLATAGILTAALSLRALWADRRHAAALAPRIKPTGAWDVPALWGLAFLSLGLSLLLAIGTGLPIYAGMNVLVVLALGLAVWALAMNREKLEGLLYKSPLQSTSVDPML